MPKDQDKYNLNEVTFYVAPKGDMGDSPPSSDKSTVQATAVTLVSERASDEAEGCAEPIVGDDYDMDDDYDVDMEDEDATWDNVTAALVKSKKLSEELKLLMEKEDADNSSEGEQEVTSEEHFNHMFEEYAAVGYTNMTKAEEKRVNTALTRDDCHFKQDKIVRFLDKMGVPEHQYSKHMKNYI